ncbi:MAG TPA: hypothetical protein VI612_00135 [Candidatus Nanoarchaeia archaeon]|nr:hypothetical protein [Candidatus Nanoarchaeia archaeon]
MTEKSPLDGLRVPTAEEMTAGIERVQKEAEQHNADLKARSKPLHELVQTACFTINSVISQSYATRVHPPLMQRVIGGGDDSSPAGYTSELVLKVTAEDSNVPVETLTFDGFSAVRAGDRVKALIPRYAVKEEKAFGWKENAPKHNVDRAYKPKEQAIELVIMEDCRGVRTDRAVDYSKFVRKER